MSVAIHWIELVAGISFGVFFFLIFWVSIYWFIHECVLRVIFIAEILVNHQTCRRIRTKSKSHDGILVEWPAVVLRALRIHWICWKWRCKHNRRANCRFSSWRAESFGNRVCLACIMAFRRHYCVSSLIRRHVLVSTKLENKNWATTQDSWAKFYWPAVLELLEVRNWNNLVRKKWNRFSSVSHILNRSGWNASGYGECTNAEWCQIAARTTTQVSC